jgi:hypothetical protein
MSSIENILLNEKENYSGFQIVIKVHKFRYIVFTMCEDCKHKGNECQFEHDFSLKTIFELLNQEYCYRNSYFMIKKIIPLLVQLKKHDISFKLRNSNFEISNLSFEEIFKKMILL